MTRAWLMWAARGVALLAVVGGAAGAIIAYGRGRSS